MECRWLRNTSQLQNVSNIKGSKQAVRSQLYVEAQERFDLAEEQQSDGSVQGPVEAGARHSTGRILNSSHCSEMVAEAKAQAKMSGAVGQGAGGGKYAMH